MTQRLLSARQVQELLDIDASTVYRMAGDGRLPAVKVGRQWRFPAEGLERMLGIRPEGTEEDAAEGRSASELAQAVVDLAAHTLGVMMVVTDMDGRPLTEVANPCPRFEARADDPGFIAECADEWSELADDPNFHPEFRLGRHGFACARSFIRSGKALTGMVLVGGVAVDGSDPSGLYRLAPAHRQRVLETLPRVAALLSRIDRACGSPNQPRSTP